MFGHRPVSGVRNSYRVIAKQGLYFVQTCVREFDPLARGAVKDVGVFGPTSWWSRSRPTYTPRPPGSGRRRRYELYSGAVAFALRGVLERFDGGRVIVAVTSTPSETGLLTHDLVVSDGVRDGSTASLVMPLGEPIPPSPAASPPLLQRFGELGVDSYPECVVSSLDPQTSTTHLSGGPAHAVQHCSWPSRRTAHPAWSLTPG
jgi:sulfide:quinone oxidoreductase